MKDGVRETIGKCISAVIIAKNNRAPQTQIFFVFDDDTYFEIYGDTFTGTGGVDKGSIAAVEEYLSRVNGNITHRFFTNGKSPPIPSPRLKKWLTLRKRAAKNLNELYLEGILIQPNASTFDPDYLKEPLRTEAIDYLAFMNAKERQAKSDNK